MKNTISIIVMILFAASLLNAKEGTTGKSTQNKKLAGTNTINYVKRININNISTTISNIGNADIDASGNSGFYFPKETRKPVFYESGFVWGGKVNGEVRVGGSTYRTGLKPGRNLDGVAEDPTLASVRVYRVRKDFLTGSMSAEIQDGEGTESQIRAQYQTDWNEWPASQGAPFEDVNNNSKYDPTIDIPGVPGADQTLWFVANDLDATQTQFLYGSNPIGLEVQVTVWGYKRTDLFGDMIFKKYKLINKSANAITDTYVSIWSDPDIGNAGDDFAGCDPALNLAYGYNSTESDNIYGTNVPAVGFSFIKGPKTGVDGSGNPIYASMNSFYFYINGNATYSDPALGSYNGTLSFYNYMQGKIGSTGGSYTDPNTGQAVIFPLSGDPISRSGWIDGLVHPAGDRRFGIGSGPFNFAAGTTQEIIFAQIVHSGAPYSPTNLYNIDGLKEKARSLQTFALNGATALLKTSDFNPLNEFFDIEGILQKYDPQLTVQNTTWQLDSGPAGATVTFENANQLKTRAKVDLAGKYIFKMVLTLSNGLTSAGYCNFTATSNRVPIADFTITPNQITWGDSTYVDASLSSDADNDVLTYKWSGNFGKINLTDGGKKGFISPYNSGSNVITLQVNDALFSNSKSASVNVLPKINNLNNYFSFIDPQLNNYSRAATFTYGKYLFITPENSNKIFIYEISSSSFTFLKSISVANAYGVAAIKGDLLYVYLNRNDGLYGSGALSIYRVSPSWEITPLLQNYLPLTGITSFSYGFMSETIAYGMQSVTLNGGIVSYSIYKVDFTNPATPAKKEIINYQTPNILRGFWVYEDYLYTIIQQSGTSNYYWDLWQKDNFKFVRKVISPFAAAYGLGKQIIIAQTDGVYFYELGSDWNYTFKQKITVTPPTSWIPAKYSVAISGSTSNGQNYIAVDAYGGRTFFDITDINNPVQLGSIFTGSSGDIIRLAKKNMLVLPSSLVLSQPIQSFQLSNFDVSPDMHFNPVWDPIPLSPLLFKVTKANLDFVGLTLGDEVGIFDGDICVGSARLTKEINSLNPLFIYASLDNPGTPAIDGFTEGHRYYLRFWKKGEAKEYSSVTPLSVGGNSTFTANSTIEIMAYGFADKNNWITSLCGNVNAAEGENSEFRLFLGMNTSATNGFDPTLSESAAPPLPPASLDAHFILPTSNTDFSFVDIRPHTETAEWTINFSLGSLGYPIVFTWNKNLLPEGSFFLQDLENGSKINVNMKTASSYTLDNITISSVKIVYRKTAPIDMNIAAGWNIISMPLAASSMDPMILFPDFASSTYGFNNGYFVANALENGKGYWLKYNSAKTVTVNGTKLSTDEIAVVNGWNMIGGYDYDANIIQSTPVNIISSQLFGYENGYKPGVVLQIGKGYWIKVNQNGVLKISPAVSKSIMVKEAASETLGEIILRDAKSKVGALVICKNINDGANYDLPPAPPSGVFDLRFNSQRNGEFIGPDGQVISFSGLEYPVKISVTNESIRVKDIINGKIINSVIKPGGELQIVNSEINQLRIFKEEIPNEFMIYQNYPNPFNPVTMIKYGIPEKANVKINIYNALGEKVDELVNEVKDAGNYEVEWNASNFSSGVYFYQIHTDKNNAVKKMLLVK